MTDKQQEPNLHAPGDYRDTWRIFRIMSEFVEGYQFLSSLEKEVTIMGSARTPEGNDYYEKARDLGKLLAEGGYTTLTGGGPGIMQAANRGAFEAKGDSIGININLPFEQKINPYVHKSLDFYYFFTRKVMLTSPAHSFVFFPGGFGTMDEFFEVVDHMELGKMCTLPLILIGKDYWEPLVKFLKMRMCTLCQAHGPQVDKWHIVDTAQEAYDIIASSEENGGRKICDLGALSFHGDANKMDWKIFRIMAELVEGFEFLTGIKENVSVLGTKSLGPDNQYYKASNELGRKLVETGYAVVTGGAPGIAEAANKGTFEVGGESYGIGMEVHGQARMNKYTTKNIMFKFPFTRKLIVTAPSNAFVFFPGGFGTMHQLFEVLTLIQTGKMQKIPVFLYNSEYWGDLKDYIDETLLKKFQTISEEDPSIFTIVDSVDEIIEALPAL